MGILPVLLIDAIPHLRRLNGALNEPCVLQLLEVLAHRSLFYGQLIVYVAEVSLPLPGQKLQYFYAGRVGKCLGKTGYLLGFDAIVFLLIHCLLRCVDCKMR